MARKIEDRERVDPLGGRTIIVLQQPAEPVAAANGA
jgi:hypothetical protein